MQEKKAKCFFLQFKGSYLCRRRMGSVPPPWQYRGMKRSRRRWLSVVPGSIKENKDEGEEGEALFLAVKGV